MNNSQKIEAYFNNELSSSEKEQFLVDLESNSELQKEFTEQKEIVQGIQEYRKAEIIQRLNEIKIVSTTQYMAVKVISSIAVVALVGLSVYFIYFNDSVETELMNDPIQQELVEAEAQPLPEQNSVEPLVADTESENQTQELSDEKTPVIPTETDAADESVMETTSEQVTQPEVTMPEVVDAFDSEETTNQSEDDISAPENTIKTDLDLRTKFEVEVKMKRKYNFHYQVVNEKLTLFGEFEDGPFEILEINNDQGVDLYLYYLDNFYGINQASEDIQALVEINDESLIGKLQQLR